MKTWSVIATLTLIFANAVPARGVADDDQPRNEVKRDLANLQGKWETTLRAGDKTIRNVQTIDGGQSKVDRFDSDGVLIHSHTASFKLSVENHVRIFTFFDLRVTEGPQKGGRFKGPRSFIYVLDGDVWTEARGLLADQPDGKPRLMHWKRLAEDKVAGADRPHPHEVLEGLGEDHLN